MICAWRLQPGEFARLWTRRGTIEVKVRADRDVPENMIFMPFCYAEAAANLLTNPALDPIGKIPSSSFVRSELNVPMLVSEPRASSVLDVRWTARG
jgi:predicted molibdopterin-dependent oxidoreductase YjgC